MRGQSDGKSGLLMAKQTAITCLWCCEQPFDGPSFFFGGGNFFWWWEQLFGGIMGQWWLTNKKIIN